MGVIIPGIVLAAGRSTRMGRAKALLPTGFQGETFIGQIVRTLRQGGLDDILVVVSDEIKAIMQAFSGENTPPRFVVNHTPELGQLSSLQVGLRTVDHPGIGGILVTLVDVPLVTTATVRALLEAYYQTHAPIVRPVRSGRHGHPVIFDRRLFEELRQAKSNGGAKAVVHNHLKESIDVEVDDEGPFLDIDTPVDYMRVFKQAIPND